jgi:hypothetical protein
MDKLYYWVGFVIVWTAISTAVAIVLYFVWGFAGLGVNILIRKYRWFNYRWFFTGKLIKTFILRQDWLRKGSPEEFELWLRAWNDRADSKALRMRREAPFYRWLWAYIIRRRRRTWAEYWA